MVHTEQYDFAKLTHFCKIFIQVLINFDLVMDCILSSSEIEFYVETMKPTDIKNIGTKMWLEWHNRLQKLNQEALIEASCMKEEHVKEYLITCNKIPVLVHEVILINIWKRKILNYLLDIVPNPENTFMAYTVLYHEAVCVALLELVLYHAGATEALQESAADLLEYAYDAACQLLITSVKDSDQKESSNQELQRQQNNLTFDIGIRSLSILRYMADNLDNVTLNVTEKIFNVYDVPVLFVEILLKKPWLNNGKQYKAGQWIEWDGESLAQPEAQIWLTLRQLLLDPACATHYPITNSRRTQFSKLLPLLQPTLLDQISPLIELHQWLCRATMSEQPSAPNKQVLLETILVIKESILNKCNNKWKKIAREQAPVIFNNNKDELKEIATSLSDAYNLDLLEKLEIKENNACAECNKPAIQRCSQCKNQWYCSRSCQVTHWPKHKEECITTAANLK